MAQVIVSTYAGTGAAFSADGNIAYASFNHQTGIAFDSSGNLYVADRYAHRVRKISTDGTVSTLAGNGTAGYADGAGSSAMFNNPNGVAVDSSGNVYVSDVTNQWLRVIAPDGTVSTLVGNGSASFADGVGTNAAFCIPNQIALDQANNLYVADWCNHRLRKVTPNGTVSTLAGKWVAGFADGVGLNAMFWNPASVALDASGNVYVTDWSKQRVRKVTPSGTVTTIAGNGVSGYVDGTAVSAMFASPCGVAVDSSGIVYITELTVNRIRMITPDGIVSTVAGTGSIGSNDGPGSNATFNQPCGLAFDPYGNLMVADYMGHRIRMITFGRAASSMPTSTTSTSVATIESMFSSQPSKAVGLTTTTALAICIPIGALVIVGVIITAYLRYNNLDITFIWQGRRPKLVLIDKRAWARASK